jgi:CRP-like cAMP-binding protein
MLKDKVAILRSFDLFTMLSDSNLNQLTFYMKEQICNRGQTVYREGIDPIDQIYLIKRGEFELVKTLLHPNEGKSPFS